MTLPPALAEAFRQIITREGFDPPATQYLRTFAAHTTLSQA